MFICLFTILMTLKKYNTYWISWYQYWSCISCVDFIDIVRKEKQNRHTKKEKEEKTCILNDDITQIVCKITIKTICRKINKDKTNDKKQNIQLQHTWYTAHIHKSYTKMHKCTHLHQNAGIANVVHCQNTKSVQDLNSIKNSIKPKTTKNPFK